MSAKRAAEARRRKQQRKLGRASQHDQAPESPPSWELLASVERISAHPLKLSLFLLQVSSALDATLPALMRLGSSSSSSSAPSEQDHTLVGRISQVAERIQSFRLKRRVDLLTPVPLDEVRYQNEQALFNCALQCFLTECQCNVAIGLLLRRTDARAGVDFPHLYEHSMLMIQRRLPVMQYSLNTLRLAVLKLIRMWHSLPILHPEFIDYLRLLRYRVSELQSAASSDLRVLDYPDWVQPVGQYERVQYYKPSLHFTREFELYFYHLARLMEHERAFVSIAQSVASFVSTEAERLRFTEWMNHNREEVFLEQWGRETVELCLKLDVLPSEREVYRWHNPQASLDQRAILQFFRRDRMDQIHQLLFANNGAALLQAQPVVARYFHAMFLLQTYADSFQLDRYVYWHVDVPAQPDGTAYPDLSFFSRLDYPIIYVPQCMQHIWLIAGSELYDCGANIDTALAEFLKRALARKDCTQFDKLRTHICTGMKAIWLAAQQVAAPPPPPPPPPPSLSIAPDVQMIAADEDDHVSHLQALLDGIVNPVAPVAVAPPLPPPAPLLFNA